MNRFFLITQVFYPDECAAASLYTDLSIELVKANNTEVTVWCAQPSYTTTTKQPRKAVYEKINIHYIPTTNFLKSNLLGRILNYISFSFFLLFKLLFSRDKHPVYFISHPPFLGLLVMFICKIRRRKFINIMLDVYPDGLIKLGAIKPNGIIAVLGKKANTITFRKASRNIVIGRDMKAWISEVCPEASDKTVYIPLWQNDSIKPILFEQNNFVKKMNLSDKFVVQYSGNMGLWHDMKTFAKAASAMEKSGVTFLFIGEGMRKQELYETWNNNVPSNTIVLPFQPKSDIGESLTACHIALISLNKGLEGVAVPSKLYGILASGVPVIALVPSTSEIAYVIQEENCGFVIEPGDVQTLIKAITELKNNASLYTEMSANSLKAFHNKYSTAIVARKYAEIIRSEAN